MRVRVHDFGFWRGLIGGMVSGADHLELCAELLIAGSIQRRIDDSELRRALIALALSAPLAQISGLSRMLRMDAIGIHPRVSLLLERQRSVDQKGKRRR